MSSIYIDRILISNSWTKRQKYTDFDIERTMIDAAQYNGLIDQFSIDFFEKNRVDILNEATLVVHYTFEDNRSGNDSLFDDASVNTIRATGKHLTRLIGKRHDRQGTLHLDKSVLSWFRSSGFVLLVTHNYTYSYTFWLHIENASSFMPLVRLVANNELFASEINESVCLLMFVANSTGASELP